jgi:hypothetical protein
MLQSNQMLIQSQFAPAETRRNIWYARIPHTTKYNDLFQPEFFTNIASQLLVGDRIECYAEDGTYYAEVMVTAVAEKTSTQNPNWAKVIEIRHIDLVHPEDKKLELPSGFECRWRGGAKWSVIRLGASEPENQIIVEKQSSRADAIREFQKLKNKLVA